MPLAPLFAGAIIVTTGTSYVLDGNGKVNTSSSSPKIGPGAALGNADLEAGLRTKAQGTVGDTYFSAHPVASSHWGVVMTEPVSTLLGEGQEAATLMHNADVALYRAKQNGRGRVEVFDHS